MEYIASDYWKVYKSIIPKEKHVQTKAATYTVEEYNSLFRHFLARMRRKAKCYSKKVEMLKLSIILLMHYRNNTLYIFNQQCQIFFLYSNFKKFPVFFGIGIYLP
jgi:insertion element IS1 protein InsB